MHKIKRVRAKLINKGWSIHKYNIRIFFQWFRCLVFFYQRTASWTRARWDWAAKVRASFRRAPAACTRWTVSSRSAPVGRPSNGAPQCATTEPTPFGPRRPTSTPNRRSARRRRGWICIRLPFEAKKNKRGKFIHRTRVLGNRKSTFSRLESNSVSRSQGTISTKEL